jgi:hypothetical protein
MKVKFEQVTEDGPVTFAGEITPEEVSFLVEYALVDLVRKGLIPDTVKELSQMEAVGRPN